jgi:uncharacterized membrane protein
MTGELESLETSDTLERRRARHWYDRLIMLSDGVFAIAITLLAADIRLPEGLNGGFAPLWAALAPKLGAYMLSFIVISVYWLSHRRYVAMIVRIDSPASVLNLVMLGLVALLPAATRLTYGEVGPSGVLLIYVALVISIGTALAMFWGYAALIGDLVSTEVTPLSRWAGFLTMLFLPPLFLLVTVGVRLPVGITPAALIGLFVLVWLIEKPLQAIWDRRAAKAKQPRAPETQE